MSPKEVAARIDAAGTAIEAELGSMSDELASWHPAEGEWCVKEVLGHLTLSEGHGFAGRITHILSEDEPRMSATGRPEPACGQNLADMLADFRAQRARSIDLVARLQPWDLDRAGIHERVGRLTVNDLLHEWVHHDRAHLKQILSNVQAYVWPAMGEPRRSSSRRRRVAALPRSGVEFEVWFRSKERGAGTAACVGAALRCVLGRAPERRAQSACGRRARRPASKGPPALLGGCFLVVPETYSRGRRMT